MNLEILSPEKHIYNGEIKLIQLPGVSGSFEILNNHAPLISALSEGKVKVISSEGAIQYFDIKGGVVEVLQNKISLLVEA